MMLDSSLHTVTLILRMNQCIHTNTNKHTHKAFILTNETYKFIKNKLKK